MTKPYDIEKVKTVLKKLFFDRWQNQENDLYSNNLDPFSAILSSAQNDMDFNNWIKSEEIRQLGKTEQNFIGTLHQELIACFDGVEDLGTGKLLDTVCANKKIIAEIKNKFNTTKGNHKVAIYDDIKKKLSESKYNDYTGYYVETIPKKPSRYDNEFTPSDNKKKTNKKRPTNAKIRIIDGVSFYDLISGEENTLENLFNDIAILIPNIMQEYEMPADNFNAEEFKILFKKVFFES